MRYKVKISLIGAKVGRTFGDWSIKIASSPFWLLVAQSLFSSWRRPRNFWKRFPLLHKYGTENTYVCTWDSLAPFAQPLGGGAGPATLPCLLYTLSHEGAGSVTSCPAYMGWKVGLKSPDLVARGVQEVPRINLRTGGWGLKRRLPEYRSSTPTDYGALSLRCSLLACLVEPIIWHMVHSPRKWLKHDFFTWIIFFWHLSCQTRTRAVLASLSQFYGFMDSH